MKRCLTLVAWVGLFLIPSPLFAWGPDGHVIVGRIAEHYLKPKARAAVADLLDNRSLGESRLANWADYIKSSAAYERKYPKHRTWHYIDIDLKQKEEDFKPPEGDNLLARIADRRKVMLDAAAEKELRKEALLFLLHFLGDMHQPLHCADRDGDKGGNLRSVRSFLGKQEANLNLHKIWDSHLVKQDLADVTAEDHAKRLVREIMPEDRTRWEKGTPTTWAWESHLIAVNRVYQFSDGKPLPPTGMEVIEFTEENYVKGCVPVVREQLKKGGVRLAKFLNDAFGDE